MITAAFFPSAWRVLFRAGFFLLCILLLLRSFIWMQQYLPEYPWLSTQEIVEGTVNRPFVYRVLMPGMIHGVQLALPDSARLALAGAGRFIVTEFAGMARLRPPNVLSLGDDFFCLRVITGLFMLAFLIGYGIGLYRLAAWFFPASPAAPYAAPLLGYAILPLGLWQAVFLYDPATLCLSAWCFYALLAGRWRLYIPLFALACLNKETSLYIVLLYCLCAAQTLTTPVFRLLLLAQLAIYALVTAATHFAFRHQDGQAAEFHGWEYLQSWLSTDTLPWLLAVLSGGFLLLYDWPGKPLLLRRSAWVAVLAATVWMLCGRMQELRGLYDVFPILTLLLTHTLVVATGADKAWLFRLAVRPAADDRLTRRSPTASL